MPKYFETFMKSPRDDTRNTLNDVYGNVFNNSIVTFAITVVFLLNVQALKKKNKMKLIVKIRPSFDDVSCVH